MHLFFQDYIFCFSFYIAFIINDFIYLLLLIIRSKTGGANIINKKNVIRFSA